MLAALRTPKTALAAVTALAIAATAPAPALAWGKNEQNFLKGMLAAAAIAAIVDHNRKSNAAEPDYRYRDDRYYDRSPRRDSRFDDRWRDDRRPDYRPPAHHSGAAAAFAEYSPASKRAIQTRLRAYGYYHGAIDGVWGPGTRAAIEAYARDTGNARALDSRDGSVRLLNGLLT